MHKENYLNYILDQLRLLPNITYTKMFGGYGLYNDGKFFAIISGTPLNLYFKTNKKTSVIYRDYKSKFFSPSKTQHLKNYYNVPNQIIENVEELASWANLATNL